MLPYQQSGSVRNATCRSRSFTVYAASSPLTSLSFSFFLSTYTDFKHVTLTIDGKRVKVQIWDTAGQERFRNITQNYYRKAQGTLLVYDVTNRESFKSVDGWMTTIQQHAGDSINKILVGNKLDCEAQRVVQTHEGDALAKKYNIKFFETSAKTQQNVTGASLLSPLPSPLPLFSLLTPPTPLSLS